MTGNGMRLPGVLGLLLFAFSGCMDEGFEGPVRPLEVFVDERGCLTQEPKTFPARVGFDIDQMEVTLEVFQGTADLVLGSGEAPYNYFSVGRGPGTQKLLVGPGSHVPLRDWPGTWYVLVAGAGGVVTACDLDEPERNPDWHLVWRRTPAPAGAVLLSEFCDSPECAVPACNAHPCPFREVPVLVPENAGSLEVVLNSFDGDADMFIVSDTGVQLGASTNPGSGYDIVVLGQEMVVPLRERTVSLRLISWAQPTDQYDLQVTYR